MALVKIAINKTFDQLLRILQISQIYSETLRSESSYIEVWFTAQDSRPLEIEDGKKLTLVVNHRGA